MDELDVIGIVIVVLWLIALTLTIYNRLRVDRKRSEERLKKWKVTFEEIFKKNGNGKH